MLVLARKRGQSVVIDNEITLTVGAFRAGEIKLLFDAPREITIVRKELILPKGPELPNCPAHIPWDHEG